VGADVEEAVLAVAALNVFMMGEALAGEGMLAAAGLATDEESRMTLRAFFLELLSARLGQPAKRPARQVPATPEKRVGNTIPGALFAALEKIVDRVIGRRPVIRPQGRAAPR